MTNEVKYKTYNGWANYETWNVKLWMDNDEGSYHYWQEVTKYCVDNAQLLEDHGKLEKYFTVKEKAALLLSKQLQEEHEENTPTVTGCYADLLNAALSEVDWHEIATSLIDEFEE